MSRRNKGNKGKSSIMLLISFCDFISSAILDFFYFSSLAKHFTCEAFHLRSISLAKHFIFHFLTLPRPL